MKKIISLLILCFSLIAVGGESQTVLVKEKMFSKLTLKPLPAHILSVIDNWNKRSIHYKYPLKNSPKLYRVDILGHVKLREKLSLKKDLSPEELECFYQFKSGSEQCVSISNLRSPKSGDLSSRDLFQEAREWTRDYGLRVATRKLYEVFGQKDESKGLAELRLKKTTQEKDFVYSDSFANLPPSENKKIGVFFLLGIGGDKSKNAEQISLSADRVREMGFHAEVLKASGTLGSAHNAEMLRDQIKEKTERFEKIIFVAASKGVADFIHYFLNFSDDLTLQQRNRVKLMVSLSGVVRHSALAKWMVDSPSIKAKTFRGGIKIAQKGKIIKGLRSLTKDQWEGHAPDLISQQFPRMLWISMPMLPEGEDGYTHLDKLANFARERLYLEAKDIGPSDGLVETAGSILPPGTGLTEWIIRVYGPHGLPLGKFDNGKSIAPDNKISDMKAKPEAGPEILDAFFRALPSSILEN